MMKEPKIGWSIISMIICVACGEKIQDHSFKDLGRCLFRIQGTMIADVKSEKK